MYVHRLHNTLLACPIRQLLFLNVFQCACPNLTFTCPGQSGKCLCSTLDVKSLKERLELAERDALHAHQP